MTVMKIWLLPEPDSPTTPTVSPSPTLKLTPFTASTIPSGVEKRTSSRSTSRMDSPVRTGLAVLGVEGVAQTVADEVEREQGHAQEDGRIKQAPRRALHHLGSLGNEHAPARLRLLHAEPEKADEAFGQDHRWNCERDVDHHRTHRVRDDVPANDVEAAHAGGMGC